MKFVSILAPAFGSKLSSVVKNTKQLFNLEPETKI